MDFLSVLELNFRSEKNSDFIVLNSLAMLNKSMEVLKAHQQVFSFLDHDHPGKVAFQNLAASGMNVLDGSALYKNYKDVNEYLVAMRRQKSIKPVVKERSVKYRRRRGIV